MAEEVSYTGQAPTDIDIEIEAAVISQALLSDQRFIDAVAKSVRNQMLKDVRTMKTLFGKWGGTTN